MERYSVGRIEDGTWAPMGLQNLDTEPTSVSYRIVTRDGVMISEGELSDLQPLGVAFIDFEAALAAAGEDPDTLGVYWMGLSSTTWDYGVTAIQTLRVGGVDLLPYGVLPSAPCARAGVIVAETERMRAGLVLLNADSEAPISCALVLTEGPTAEPVARRPWRCRDGPRRASFWRSGWTTNRVPAAAW